jgi:hypothetical protein
MERISITTAVKVLAASAIATACSFVMAIVMAMFVPVVIEGTNVGARPPEQRTYTLEELNRAEEEAKARMKARMEDKSFENHAKILRSMQRPAIWISWLPWLLLPFVVPLTRVVHVTLVLAFPGLLVVSTTAPPEVLAVFAVALGVGAGVRHAYSRAHAT